MYPKNLKQLLSCGVLASVMSGGVAVAELEEIIVTAQKREQNTQDIGIAISAITGDTLKELGIADAVGLGAQVPGVDIKYSEGRTNPIITIRGVGLNDNRPNNNPSTAVHIDEVYLSSAAYLSAQLFDIERVEVLKGPQGTLYGRNSTAGTVNFITRQPSQESDGYVEVGYGNYNSFNLNGALGGALSDTVSGRFAFDYKKSDSYVTNLGTAGYEGFSINPLVPGNEFLSVDDKAAHVDTKSWRASLLFEPNDKFDALLSFHGANDSSGNDIWASIGDPLVVLLPFVAFTDTDGDPHKRYSHVKPSIDSDSFGGFLKMNYDMGFATLTSITAYEDLDRVAVSGDSTPINILGLDKHDQLSQLTQELRLTSNSDSAFQWIVGAFYSDDEVDVTEVNDFSSALASKLTNAYVQDGDSFAVFAHTEYQFTESLKLIAGIRYTEEEKTYEGGTVDENPWGTSCLLARLDFSVCLNPENVRLTGPVTLVDAKKKYETDAWSGKIGLDWNVNDVTLVYGSVSKGFKSGGIDGSTVFSEDDLDPFDAETLWAYEMGIKVDLTDNSRLNASLFYYDYEDIQVQALVINAATGLPNTQRSNAGKASVVGAELEWLWRPTEGLSINLGASFLDSEIKEFDSLDPEERAAFEGNQLQDAPEFTFNGIVRYEWMLDNNMHLAAMTDFNYNDDTFRELSNDPYYQTESYWLVNGRVSLTSSDDSWTASLWVKNLADEEYVTNTSDSPGQGRWELPGAPRTYGVSMNYRW